MIFGKPADLFATAVLATFNLFVLVVVSTADATGAAAFVTLAAILTPIVIGGVNLALGAWIGFLAFQPPTLNVGDKFSIQTPPGEPNQVATVGDPPAPSIPKPEPGT